MLVKKLHANSKLLVI